MWAYGVRRIYGIKGGYKGILEPDTWLLGKDAIAVAEASMLAPTPY